MSTNTEKGAPGAALTPGTPDPWVRTPVQSLFHHKLHRTMGQEQAFEHAVRKQSLLPTGRPRGTPRWETVPSRRQRAVPDSLMSQVSGRCPEVLQENVVAA